MPPPQNIRPDAPAADDPYRERSWDQQDPGWERQDPGRERQPDQAWDQGYDQNQGWAGSAPRDDVDTQAPYAAPYDDGSGYDQDADQQQPAGNDDGYRSRDDSY